MAYKWKDISFSRSFAGQAGDSRLGGLQGFECRAWSVVCDTLGIDRTAEVSGAVSSYRLRPGSYARPTSELDVFFKFEEQRNRGQLYFALALNESRDVYRLTPFDDLPVLGRDSVLAFATNGWTTRKHLQITNPGADPILAFYVEDQNQYETAG